MAHNRKVYLTIAITIFLFSFVTFLIYTVYCYAYYDKNEEEIYTTNFNKHDYNYIYDNIYNPEDLSKEDFNVSLDLMYNKNNLKNIYYLYYKNTDIYDNVEDFITTYYFGDTIVKRDDIIFESFGKTNFFKRRSIKYFTINLKNNRGYKTSLGLKKDVTLKIEDNATLKLNDDLLSCPDSLCHIDNLFGGVYKIIYKSNKNEYFGLISITQDNEIIDISTLDNLVKINGNDDESSSDNPVIENAKLNIGKYTINKCFLENSCASKPKSYLLLNEDNTAHFYTYIPFEVAHDDYLGTYEIKGEFLILKFASHTYRVFDYDTKEFTNIDSDVEVEMRFKIINPSLISNESYQLKYSA